MFTSTLLLDISNYLLLLKFIYSSIVVFMKKIFYENLK